MSIAIINKSNLDFLDNWHASLFTKTENLLQLIPKDLNRIDIKLMIEKNLNLLKANESLLSHALIYERELVAAIMGGVSKDSFVTATAVLSYCSAQKRDLTYYRRSLLITMVLLHSIKKHKEELLEYIQSEISRWSSFKSQVEVVINS